MTAKSFDNVHGVVVQVGWEAVGLHSAVVARESPSLDDACFRPPSVMARWRVKGVYGEGGVARWGIERRQPWIAAWLGFRCDSGSAMKRIGKGELR